MIPVQFKKNRAQGSAANESLSPLQHLELIALHIDFYQVEKDLIRRALTRARGNQTQASRLLSITRDTLRYKMKKYGLGKHDKELLETASE